MTPRLLSSILVACTVLAGCAADETDEPKAVAYSSPTTKGATDTLMAGSQNDNTKQKNSTDAMRELRMKALTTPVAEIRIQKNDDFPRVYGVLLEFPIDKNTATVVSLCDGNASLYTTSTFGVIGGFEHDNVRAAAIAFVKTAATLHDDAVPTSDYPYPDSGRVRFYLLTFSGVRVIDTDLASIEAGRSKYVQLFDLGQKVLTELRLTIQSDE